MFNMINGKLENSTEELEQLLAPLENGNVDLSFFEKLWQSFLDYVPTLILAIVIYLVGCILNKVVLKLLGKGLEKSRLDKTVHEFIKSTVKIVLFGFIIVIVLTVLGIPMTSIITVIGSAGIAIGLALQSSLSNVAGGVIVLMGKNFKVGDYVCINGDEGTVAEISVICTKIITVDNKAIYIPNGTVSNAVVTNYTQERTRRVDLVFGISYDNDVKKAISVINNVLAENSKVLVDPSPFVHISAFSSSSVDITVRAWTESANYWDVYFALLQDIKEAFDKNDIVIPYNQIDVHMIENK
ncbi:MAG: mechanosensitive ion channel [Oscillospiraceae bacterium]|nr:mechanosensitive ion channel [Oscillospiraceae bacterium]